MTGESQDDQALHLAASLTLAPVPESARQARRFITRFCTAAGVPDDLCQTAALVTSELVTNAVLHGRTAANLVINRPPNVLRVAVADDNPELPVEPAQHPDATSGRGMLIVAALTDRWGVELRPDGGKEVWFELDVPHESV